MQAILDRDSINAFKWFNEFIIIHNRKNNESVGPNVN